MNEILNLKKLNNEILKLFYPEFEVFISKNLKNAQYFLCIKKKNEQNFYEDFLIKKLFTDENDHNLIENILNFKIKLEDAKEDPSCYFIFMIKTFLIKKQNNLN